MTAQSRLSHMRRTIADKGVRVLDRDRGLHRRVEQARGDRQGGIYKRRGSIVPEKGAQQRCDNVAAGRREWQRGLLAVHGGGDGSEVIGVTQGEVRIVGRRAVRAADGGRRPVGNKPVEV